MKSQESPLDAIQDRPWAKLHAGATVVDMHAHPSLKVSLFRRSLARAIGSSRHLWPPTLRTSLSQLRDGGVDVLLSAVYPPEHGLRKEWRPIHLLRLLMPLRWHTYYARPYFDVTLQMMSDLEKELAACDPAGTLATVVRTPAALAGLLRRPAPRPVAFIHCVEGAHCLDGNLENVAKLADRGVAYLTLAHFYENTFAPPCYPFDEKMNRPGLFDQRRDLTRSLTTAGEQLIECLSAAGILPDICHCTPVARRRVYQVLPPNHALIASHVGVRAINPSPYNLDDDEIRIIANRGGVVGVIFMNYWLAPYRTSHGLNEIVQTVKHLVKTGGVGCVALGTDFDGFTDPPDDVKDARELPQVTSRLLAEGFSERDVEAMLGGNATALLLRAWRGSTAREARRDGPLAPAVECPN